ncbi:MAG: FAD-dependent oxidoreductase, partial [Telluria sp.]
MRRRQFIGGIGALVSLAGCASTGAGGRRHVVVVGGGYGGATAARYIRLWSEGAIDVTLVEPNATFVSCPLSNLVLGGSKSMADITLGY